MRILQINNFHYRKGGSETVYFNTAELLENHGHEVSFFSIKNDKLNEPCEDEKYFISNQNFLNNSFTEQVKSVGRFFYSKEAKAKLEKLIIKKKPQIAHLHLFYGGLTSSVLPVLKKYSVKVVATMHDYKLLCPVYTFLDKNSNICEKCASGNYFYCIANNCNKNSFFYSTIIAAESYYRDKFFSPVDYINKIIMVSKFSLNKHLEYKPKLADKLEHIYNFYPNLQNQQKKEFKKNYFLFIGRLSREKGLITLLNAFENINNFQLKIAGDGPLRNLVERRVSENTNIEYLGYRNKDEIKGLIDNAYFIVIPSEWYENNPMSIIESYAHSTPVIASNIGGIPEIVIEGKTGFLFESKNEIKLNKKIKQSLEIQPNEYFKMSEEAKSFAQVNFNSTVYYNKLMSVYTGIL